MSPSRTSVTASFCPDMSMSSTVVPRPGTTRSSFTEERFALAFKPAGERDDVGHSLLAPDLVDRRAADLP